LEELKTENLRLQRLVDLLDSQPEIIFSVTTSGKITYISDRALNFIRVNSAMDEDEDPTHINQLFTKESAQEVLDMFQSLHQHSLHSTDNDLVCVKVLSFLIFYSFFLFL
jgi:PAS domain-containing protein